MNESHNLLTVPQFAEQHSAFSVGGLRWQIFNSENNGLKEAGAIIRLGGKVLINVEKYFQWVNDQQVV